MKREVLVPILKNEAQTNRDRARRDEEKSAGEGDEQGRHFLTTTASARSLLAGIWDEVAAEVEAVLTELNDLREVHEQMIRDLDACEKALDLCENPARKSLGIAGELAGDF
jgi:hypothetical protein